MVAARWFGPPGTRLLVTCLASWLQFLVPGHRLLASRFRNSRFQTYDVTFTEACMTFDGFGHDLGAFMEQFSVRFSEYIEKRRKLDSIGKNQYKIKLGCFHCFHFQIKIRLKSDQHSNCFPRPCLGSFSFFSVHQGARRLDLSEPLVPSWNPKSPKWRQTFEIPGKI